MGGGGWSGSACTFGIVILGNISINSAYDSRFGKRLLLLSCQAFFR